MPKPAALTISGSDPSGGAGLQADLKTFHQFGVYGMAVPTLITVQNTQRVSRVEVLPAELVYEQIRAVVEDIPPGAVKTGSLGSAETVETIAALADGWDFPLVVDPVMISKHGAPLMAETARDALVRALLPQAFLVTPNVPEAEALTGLDVRDSDSVAEAARRIADMGPDAVLLKGGHLDGEPRDLLLYQGSFFEFPGERIETRHTHGTGCTYSAAITALLARGVDLVQAVDRAKRFISAAIADAPGLGSGFGPVEHHTRVDLH
jgi:hydroxymethylpyrimidine/phosphomethylpyrimidine kinase